MTDLYQAVLDDRDRLLDEIEKRDIRISELERAISLRDQVHNDRGGREMTSQRNATIPPIEGRCRRPMQSRCECGCPARSVSAVGRLSGSG